MHCLTRGSITTLKGNTICVCMLVPQSCLTLCNPMDLLSTRLLFPWNSPGTNTRAGCHSLLQGIFPTQESNPGLLHCRQIPYCLSHQGSPRILEWVAYPFSRATFQPRIYWTRVSCIAGGFFTSCATREALSSIQNSNFNSSFLIWMSILSYLISLQC